MFTLEGEEVPPPGEVPTIQPPLQPGQPFPGQYQPLPGQPGQPYPGQPGQPYPGQPVQGYPVQGYLPDGQLIQGYPPGYQPGPTQGYPAQLGVGPPQGQWQQPGPPGQVVYQSFPQLPDQGHYPNPAVTSQPVSNKSSPGKKKEEKEKKTGMERLASLGGVLVKQKADEMEDVTGIEKENKYKVLCIFVFFYFTLKNQKLTIFT